MEAVEGNRTGVTYSVLNQNMRPCFRMNHRRRHVLMYSPANGIE